MVSYHRFDGTAETSSCGHKLTTANDVALHDHALFRRQFALLPKERGELFVNLSDIMQQSGPLDAVEIRSGEPHLASNRRCVLRYPPRMARRIRIPGLHCLDHQLQLLLQLLLKLQVSLI